MADEAVSRPLVVRFGALGDLIQATSLFQSLYQAWGQPCDLLAAHGWPADKSLWLLARAGVAHAAATLGCPVAVLQGMTDPRRWQVIHRMEAIDVDAVLEAWQAACASRPVAEMH